MISLHKPPFRLKELKIEVTHRCPLNCIHCSSDAMPSNTLEMQQAACLHVLKEAATLGVRSIALSGGEPLVWPGIENAVGAAREADMTVTVYTSGNIDCANARMKGLAAAGVSTMIFSIFAASRATHERVTRVRGSFEKTKAAIRASRRAGMPTGLHFVPLTDNYKELEGIAKLGRELGVSGVSVLRFVPQGRGQLLRRHVLDKRQNLELARTILRLRDEKLAIRTGSPYNFLMLNDQPACSSGIDRLILGPDMGLAPCDAFKQVNAEALVGTASLSSLAGTSLRKCWEESPYLQAVRAYLTTPFAPTCRACRRLERCLSGCLAQKVATYGDLGKRPDPDCLCDKGG